MLADGQAQWQAGNRSAARMPFEQVLALDAEHPDAWHALALLDLDEGRVTRALDSARKAVAAYPRHAPFHVSVARIHLALGDVAQAQDALRRAAGSNVEVRERWTIRDNTLVREALVSRDVVRERSAFAAKDAPAAVSTEACASAVVRADALRKEGRHIDAEVVLRTALDVRPDDDEARLALARILVETLRFDEAADVYRTIVRDSGGTSPQAAAELAKSLAEIGEADEGRAIAEAALAKTPASLRVALPAKLMLSPVYATREALAESRARYCAGLDALASRRPQFARADAKETLSALAWSNFYLPYQGENDLEPQSAYGDFATSLLDTLVPHLRVPLERRRVHNRKIRIGFASHYFYRCSAGAYFRNWIAKLDRGRFEVFVYHFRASLDDVGRAIADSADRFHTFDAGVFAGDAIRRDDLDILVYPELGGHGQTFLHAALRLAPVQCAGWGHPVTSGLPTIDYFFSSGLMEPDDAQAHYRERLVRLPGIGTDYTPPPLDGLPDQARARQTLGLPSNRRLYLFPQSIYKIHPDNDALLGRLLAADPQGQLLLFAGHTAQTTEQFLQRFARTLASFGIAIERRVTLLPIMSRRTYLEVNAACDVMLDSLHWSGGNTSLDAFAVGLPVVTLPGRFMRGRQTLGMLTTLGLTELVASDAERYIALAVEIARDPGRQHKLRERIASTRGHLFHDRAAIDAMQDFYLSLSAGDVAPWRPNAV